MTIPGCISVSLDIPSLSLKWALSARVIRVTLRAPWHCYNNGRRGDILSESVMKHVSYVYLEYMPSTLSPLWTGLSPVKVDWCEAVRHPGQDWADKEKMMHGQDYLDQGGVWVKTSRARCHILCPDQGHATQICFVMRVTAAAEFVCWGAHSSGSNWPACVCFQDSESKTNIWREAEGISLKMVT